MTAPPALILDVDTGIDDALALALATRATVEFVAATSVAGNVEIEAATANTLTVLDWLGADGVPVHRGASRPLARQHQHAKHVHGETGLGGAVLAASERAVGADRGPAAIIRLATSRPGEITLVCLGPLTNLAIALNVEPRLPGLLREVVVMGGAFAVPGNITPAAEFNVYADPEAADQVFNTAFPRLTAIGLDVTQQVAWSASDWERAADRTQLDPAARLAVDVCRQFFRDRPGQGFFLHDPLALGVAIEPAFVECEEVSVSVVSDGEARGKTKIVAGSGVHVARTVDGARFHDWFLATVGLPGGATVQ